MKRTKAGFLLLSLALMTSFAIPARADGSGQDSGMIISETATANADGTYTVSLEAYAEGRTVIAGGKKDIPTDIVLVLDQSGMMAGDMNAGRTYSEYDGKINSDLYDCRVNGGRNELYYPLDVGYVQVQVERNAVMVYTIYSEQTNETYYSNRNNLYFKTQDGTYQKAAIERTGDLIGGYTYTYMVDTQTVLTSSGAETLPDFENYIPNLAGQDYEYTYFYQLAGQNRVDIEKSSGQNTSAQETYYYASAAGTTTRIAALKSALHTFENSISARAAGADGIPGTADDVNHRVAVVGFAGGSQFGYENTGVFVGSTQYGYGGSAQGVCGTAFQDMNTQTGRNNVKASINALTAQGAAQADLGMEMANSILNANPVPTGEERARVVVLFTGGFPSSGSGFEANAANAAVSRADSIRAGGATVYSVGIFDGADATSAGDPNGNDTQKANRFMQSVSNNRGTPRNPGYYLSASDAGTLSSIFHKVSDSIRNDGSSITPDEQTVIRDVIAPAFVLPGGADASDIVLETYSCTGKDGDEYTWEKNADAMGAAAEIGSTDTGKDITTDNQISVTGFNFSENYVGTVTENGAVSYRGDKLVIRFKVKTRDGFFGGNGVDITGGAGVYKNAAAAEPIIISAGSKADVPAAAPVVRIPDDKYLGAYYLQGVSEDAIKKDAAITIGGCDIDLGKADDPENPYGVRPWQMEYADVFVTAAARGNGGSFEKIQEDIIYTVTVNVVPKTETASAGGSASGTGTGVIHVFKPCLTYRDSEVYYGDAAPVDFSGNQAEETWLSSDAAKKHNDNGVAMLNNKPALTLTYTPDETKLAGGKINTKQDVAVDARVQIGNTDVTGDTAFIHTDCTGGCSRDAAGANAASEFMLHVKTCSLTVVNTGGTPGEPYVFTVFKDGNKYSEVTISGNGSETIYELPVGTYTIQEDTGWSGRCLVNNDSSAVLTRDNENGSITCANTQVDNGWLSAFSDVVTKIFGRK